MAKKKLEQDLAEVSILILLEVSLEVLDMMTKSGVKSSFNPYFVGSESGRSQFRRY